MEQAYFAGLNFRDLAKKYVETIKNTSKTLRRNFCDIFKIAKISPAKISNNKVFEGF